MTPIRQVTWEKVYERHSILSIESVLSLIPDYQILLTDNLDISIRSRRLRVYAEKGVICVTCGIVGTHFAIERHRGHRRWHINLYCDNGRMMTVDHIVPKSRGGKNHMTNLQPMCFNCNNRKGSKMPSLPVAA
jgi:5-methylcytosine-specific restriction endonuclease McrA